MRYSARKTDSLVETHSLAILLKLRPNYRAKIGGLVNLITPDIWIPSARLQVACSVRSRPECTTLPDSTKSLDEKKKTIGRENPGFWLFVESGNESRVSATSERPRNSPAARQTTSSRIHLWAERQIGKQQTERHRQVGSINQGQEEPEGISKQQTHRSILHSIQFKSFRIIANRIK